MKGVGDMKITGIKKHRGAGMWYGSAVEGGKRFQWYYRPRSLFHMTEEEGSIPNSWMNVHPPVGAKRAVLRAIRAAKV